MCIAFIKYSESDDYPIIIFNNRDEYVERVTERLRPYPNHNNDNQTVVNNYFGRDSVRGGTWLAINDKGLFAILLNNNELGSSLTVPPLTTTMTTTTTNTSTTTTNSLSTSPTLLSSNFKKMSRGEIPIRFINSNEGDPLEFIQQLDKEKYLYPNFNLIVGDVVSRNMYCYYSSDSRIIKIENNQVFGVSNYSFVTECRKIEIGIETIKNQLQTYDQPRNSNDNSIDIDKLLNIMTTNNNCNLTPPPQFKNANELNQLIYIPKINTPEGLTYGSRTTSIIVVDKDLNVHFIEKENISSSSQIEDNENNIIEYKFKIKSNQC
eukprot:gene3591-4473_t